MTILNVAYPFAPVSREAVGGAEQVVAVIDQALAMGGLGSIVVAAKGSRTSGALIELQASEQIDDNVRTQTYRDYARLIVDTITERQVDLVHMHGVDFAQYLPDTSVPVLVTLHLPLDYYPKFPPRRPCHTVFNAVSEWQRRRCPTELGLELICNGVDIDSLFPSGEKADFVLMLGRICPEKGFHLGLEAAISARVTCLLAGQVYGYADHQRYFNREVLPRLDAERRFVGPVGGTFKRHLLSAAKCVLIPSLVAETSSLVAMEALACGTPVIAFRSGALVDIVTHQRTGFLVNNVAEMAQAISATNRIDPAECRKDACRRFSAVHMVGKYLRLYERMIESGL